MPSHGRVRHLPWILLGVFLASPAVAQVVPLVSLDPELQLTQYPRDAWLVQDGLPQNSIDAILRSSDGYLWIGTQEGLARYDGRRFKLFEQSVTDGLNSNQISSLLEDRSGNIWIGTNGGGLSVLHDREFEVYDWQDGLSSNAVSTLYEDRKGYLWVGTTGGGLNRFDGQTFITFTTEDGLPGNTILTLMEDAAGVLWVATQAGLSRFSEGTFTLADSRSELPGEHVRAMHSAEDGSLWLGTDQGLVRMVGDDLTTHTTTEGLCGNVVTSLLEDPAGALWVGTRDGGLCRLYRGKISTFGVQQGLTNVQVRSLHLDREGSLWIGTDGGGLSRLRPGKFASLTAAEGLSSEVVLSVMEDSKGYMWFGTEGGGLNRVRGSLTEAFTTEHGLSSNVIYALHEDRRGNVWAGTADAGICRFDDGRFTCFAAGDGFTGNTIYAIHQDRKGRLWIGTEGGLGYLSNDLIIAFDELGTLSHLVTAIHEDGRGGLWFGTYGGGLARLEAGELTHFSKADGLSSDLILTLFQDQHEIMWIGTHGGGLCRLDDRFVCFTAADGLANDNVLQILDDPDGYLWLGTLKGITRVSMEEISDFVDGRRARLNAHTYNEADGMKSGETNGGVQPAAWKARDGRLWFGTMAGVAVIDPARIYFNPVPPPVIIENFYADDRPVALTGNIRLPPGSKRLEFHYAGLSLVSPQQVRFMYQLEGYDDDWIEAGSRVQATFTNLPPGTYRFRVKARNGDGVWNAAGDTVAFYVSPFFYQTWWFILLSALALGVAGVGGYRLRTRHLRTRESELQELVDEQTRELLKRERELQSLNQNLKQEVRQQLDVILEERERYEGELIDAKEKAEESARLKSAILMNMSHEIRTPITAILGFAQVLSEEVDPAQQEFIDYIVENGKRLLNTLNSILDLAKLETHSVELDLTPLDLTTVASESVHLFTPIARKKGLTIRAELAVPEVAVPLDRTAIDRILQNLIGNAIKFTNHGSVTVRVTSDDELAYLSVRDTGIGISESFLPHLFEEFKQESTGLSRSHEGSGLGLAITRRLVEALNGTIDVRTEKDKGTEFVVSLPRAADTVELDNETPRPHRMAS
jgi:signal transduction histidine kinase/ligand-binding sensor domain-containing protein